MCIVSMNDVAGKRLALLLATTWVPIDSRHQVCDAAGNAYLSLVQGAAGRRRRRARRQPHERHRGCRRAGAGGRGYGAGAYSRPLFTSP